MCWMRLLSTPSCPALSCPVLSCPVLLSPVLPCPVLSCPVLSCPVLSCPVLSFPALPCPALPYPALPCPVPSRPTYRIRPVFRFPFDRALPPLPPPPPPPPLLEQTKLHTRIGNPEFNLAQGAFRSGKYKYMANAWCSGWYTFDRDIQNTDPLTDLTSQCDGNACSDCGQGCTKKPYDDFLFDLEADPREETNLVEVYPEVSYYLFVAIFCCWRRPTWWRCTRGCVGVLVVWSWLWCLAIPD